MKFSLSGPSAVIAFIALLLGVVVVARLDLPPFLRGLVQVSGRTGGSGAIQFGTGRSGRLAHRVSGAATAEERRRLWAGGPATLSLDYDVAVERGRVRISVESIAMRGRSIWWVSVEQDRRDRAAVALPGAGNYEVVVRVTAFSGRYDVSYAVR